MPSLMSPLDRSNVTAPNQQGEHISSNLREIEVSFSGSVSQNGGALGQIFADFNLMRCIDFDFRIILV